MSQHCHCNCHEGSQHIHKQTEKSNLYKIVFSSFCFIIALTIQYMDILPMGYSSYIKYLYLLAYLPVAWPVFQSTWDAIKEKEYFSEFLLMSIATLGAFVLGEYPEAVAVMLLYTIGEHLQDRAVDRAKQNITSLVKMQAKNATRINENGGKVVVDPKDIEIGDRVEVKVGQRVPVDGILVRPRSVSFNTSALTGESAYKDFSEGQELLSGMIPVSHPIEISVTRVFENSALSKILKMVSDANEHKAPTELLTRKLAKVYTPIVIIIAVLTFLIPFFFSLFLGSSFVWQDALNSSLILLVIACPCALVLSIPLSYFAAIGTASGLGILFKGGNYIDALANVDKILLDKTGTVTSGVFSIVETKEYSPLFKNLLYQLESVSSHPIAVSIAQYLRDNGVDECCNVRNIIELPGRGIKGEYEGKIIRAGKQEWVKQFLCKKEEDRLPTGDSNTSVWMCLEDQLLGYIKLQDLPRPEAKETIQELKDLGIKEIIMLSGDKDKLVQNISQGLGLSSAFGDLLPQNKLEYIEKIQSDAKYPVVFVGDGINDAPALTIADVGIAMGAQGADVAMESADVVLQAESLRQLPIAIRIARYTKKIIWQNIIFIFSVKVLIILLALLHHANMWEAVFADVGVTLIAVLNTLRIKGSNR